MSLPNGRVLVVGSPACRAHAKTALSRLPFEFAAVDDPYAAAMELSRRPLAYRAVVLCLNSVFREELGLISLIKLQMRHLDVFLSQTDGRQAAIVDATRRGADGILGDEGLFRFDDPARDVPPQATPSELRGTGSEVPDEGTETGTPVETVTHMRTDDADRYNDGLTGDAVLTAEELRALLQEQPSLPPGSE
ncbi:MAG TPA: hypothetical protein PLD59_06130 [Tepidisphaeraceae bacterium]|nr:hypothetical protein [Tepidisphaeraceae bacterium]